MLSPTERAALIKQWLPLTLKLTAAYRYRSDYDDLVAEARYAMTRASMTYNPALGEFSTYVYPAIVRAVATALAKSRRWPTFSLDEPGPHQRRSANGNGPLSAEDATDDFDITYEDTPHDMGNPEDMVVAADEFHRLRLRLLHVNGSKMDARTSEILRRASGGESLASIGRSMGISRERVRQIVNRNAAA